MKAFWTDVMAAIVRISSPHLNSWELSSYTSAELGRNSQAWRRGLTIAAIIGSRGTSAILAPNGFVNRPSSSKAFKLYKNSRALIIISLGGGDMKSNFARLSIPKALSWSRYIDTSDRVSSGGVVIGIGEYVFRVGRRVEG
jgi:hypothetical protein